MRVSNIKRFRQSFFSGGPQPVKIVRIAHPDGLVEYKKMEGWEREDAMLLNRDFYTLEHLIETGNLKEVSIPQLSPSSDSFDDSAVDDFINSSVEDLNK